MIKLLCRNKDKSRKHEMTPLTIEISSRNIYFLLSGDDDEGLDGISEVQVFQVLIAKTEFYVANSE